MGLVRKADSVELKLTVVDADQRSAVETLDLDVLEGQIRQVVFYDTPDLDLDRAGVVVRTRRVQGKSGDTTVKLRPVDPAQLPTSLRESPDFSVEVDAMPGTVVCSGSLKARADNAAIREVMRGTRPLKKVLSKPQRALLSERAPEGIDLTHLVPLGPIPLLKLRFRPSELPRSMVAELWFYPDGSRILELSTKSTPDQMFQALAETAAFLTERRITLTGEQTTKTRTALTYFAGLKKEAPAS
jgi:hypothetical protein